MRPEFPSSHLGGIQSLGLFNDIPSFIAAAEAGSFSDAGRELRLTRSAVGKAVARLEARLGVRLFVRTTRAQHLTDEGRVFLERCLRATTELREGAAMLEAGREKVHGLLRVTMPVLYGRMKVAPLLTRLAGEHPDLTIELDLRDRHALMLEEGFDLAVRSGPLGQAAGLASRVIARHETVLCGAPTLIERHGVPASSSDLARYNALAYRREGWSEPWALPDPEDQLQLVEPRARILAADLGVLFDAAVAGEGLAWLPDWLVEDALSSGALIALLPNLPRRRHDIHLVWATSADMPARLQVAVRALTQGR